MEINANTRFKITRKYFTPGYDVQVEGSSIRYYAAIDFRNLVLRQRDQDGPTVSLSAFPILSDKFPKPPWFSRDIFLCFASSDEAQNRYWEKMASVWEKAEPRKQRRESAMEEKQLSDSEGELDGAGTRPSGKDKYTWITHWAGGAEVCITIRAGLGPDGRNYVMQKQERDDQLAEFVSEGHLYTGGVLVVKQGLEERVELKILMAFLAAYEKARRQAHWTLYRPLERRNRVSFEDQPWGQEVTEFTQ